MPFLISNGIIKKDGEFSKLMIWNPFKMISKNFLGIDIGTSSLKVIELSRFGQRTKLENYGELKVPALYKQPFRTAEKSTLLLSSSDIARAIRAILEEAKIKTKEVAFSIPDFSSLFTWFHLPSMSREEIAQAVRFEARQHIPLPLAEVTLDWQIIDDQISNQQKTKFKILLVAVPNEIINQYQEIANLAQLELQALEAEVFGLSRSSIKEEKKVVALVDIGARSTTVSIIDKGILKISHSFDLSGNELTQVISQSLNINYQEAEELKKKQGLTSSEKNLREILLPLIDLILAEIKKTAQNFYQTETKEVEKIVLAGGSALLPGLKEYFTEQLKKEIAIASPFSEIFYPPILEQTLREIGPSYAISVGMALRGLE